MGEGEGEGEGGVFCAARAQAESCVTGEARRARWTHCWMATSSKSPACL